ncbi:hypothetical protein AURDEDRAFT_160919 [Auricularia subglabra TFB-10046 SS5]|nr:hypothetical protein AURDEDRAFT_160919 [Auricularia subglabra TFB-10046 SS5]
MSGISPSEPDNSDSACVVYPGLHSLRASALGAGRNARQPQRRIDRGLARCGTFTSNAPVIRALRDVNLLHEHDRRALWQQMRYRREVLLHCRSGSLRAQTQSLDNDLPF